MKLVAFFAFGFFAMSLTATAQTESFFPGSTLYWTNLQKPNFLDSLKSLKLLTYKNKGVVHNKTFFREINEADSIRRFRTSLDFYEYKIYWKRKGRKRFKVHETGDFYFYYGYAAAIYQDKYF